MCQTSISVWFVCRLCRGSFGQVDAFIEHKKQKHFTQFQNTTSIVFQEAEDGTLGPLIIKEDPLLPDENNEPPIKIEVNEDDFMIHFNSEIVQEPNLDLAEPKSELITYESEVNPDNENNYLSLDQPEQNPYVLLKRLTSDEILRARFPQHHFTVLKYNNNSSDDDGNVTDHNEVENPTENQPSPTFVNTSTEHDLGFECKLCSKQLESEAHLKIHVGICALYHTDRKRFCVTCNRKLCDRKNLKRHRLRFHGTEEEKLSLQKFKCHLCPKRYRDSRDLGFHLKSHKNKKQQVKIRPSNSKLLKCSHPNCGKEFGKNSYLQKHIATSHLGLRPFSCSYPNCDKTFRRKDHVDAHCRLHTGERPYKCTVDNCDKSFTFCAQRTRHYRTEHNN